MSPKEALQWMEKCFCHEHEGYHLSAKSYQRLLSELRRFADNLDYLWPVNREMSVMASGSSIDKAIQNNIKTFKQFSKSIAHA
jgi:galactokinase/mevalonate kinase-like predicted kinase